MSEMASGAYLESIGAELPEIYRPFYDARVAERELAEKRQLLFLYSEWLDAEGLIRSPDETLDYDTRTLDALVIAFLDREK